MWPFNKKSEPIEVSKEESKEFDPDIHCVRCYQESELVIRGPYLGSHGYKTFYICNEHAMLEHRYLLEQSLIKATLDAWEKSDW
jgi:hypothetical protein